MALANLFTAFGLNALEGAMNADAARKQAKASRDAWKQGQPYAQDSWNRMRDFQSFKPTVDWSQTNTFDGTGIINRAGPPPNSVQPIQNVGLIEAGKNTNRMTALDQSRFFDKYKPYDPREQISQAPPVNLEGFFAGIQAYNPTDVIKAAGAPPSLKQMLQMGTVKDSEFSKIVNDPKTIQLQQKALAKLQEIADNDGMTIADKVRLRESMDQVARQQRMQRYAVMQHYESMGLGGSAIEMAASLQTGQDAVETLSKAGAEAAAMGSERAMQATIQLGAMATTLRDQAFREQAAKAQAMDEIAKFNAAQSMQAVQAEYQNRMQLAQTVAQAGQQFFGNMMALRTAQANAKQQSYENVFRFREAMANAGQQWFSNVMNLAHSRYQAAQQAYENAFALARAKDDYAIAGWEMAFNKAQAVSGAMRADWQNKLGFAQAQYGAAQDAYQSYVNRLERMDEQSRFAWGANFDLERARSADGFRMADYMSSQPGVPSKGGLLGGLGGLGGGILDPMLNMNAALWKGQLGAAKWAGKKVAKFGDWLDGPEMSPEESLRKYASVPSYGTIGGAPESAKGKNKIAKNLMDQVNSGQISMEQAIAEWQRMV